MRAITYQGIKDVKVNKLSLDQGEHAYEIFDEKKDNCIKVILKP